MKTKQWVTGLALLSMLLGSVVQVSASSNPTVQAYDEGGVKVVLQFKDLKEAEWASRYIASMEANGVFKGFEDGTFRPNESITRLQAIITAVRLMGLEEEAREKMNVELNFKDADLIKRNYIWATGYIAIALEKGLFDSVENELHPNDPATRLWVSSLLVRALGLESLALSRMNTELPFVDRAAIPAASVGYISVAVEKGILKGYPDNTFRPYKAVTRAEMAALLDRTDEEMPLEYKLKKKHKKVELEGTVTAITSTSISIKDEDQHVTKIDLANKIVIFHGKGRGTLGDISVGDKVEIKLSNGRAVLIDVERESEEEQQIKFEIKGILVKFDLQSITIKKENGQIENYDLAANLKIDYEGHDELKLSDLEPGTKVEVEGYNQLVHKIKLLED